MQAMPFAFVTPFHLEFVVVRQVLVLGRHLGHYRWFHGGPVESLFAVEEFSWYGPSRGRMSVGQHGTSAKGKNQ